MSLFEQPGYQWRETYFVLFDQDKRPSADQLQSALSAMNSRWQFEDLRAGEDGLFESLTLISPEDFAAMDITCVAGEEVREQIPALVDELKPNLDTSEEKAHLPTIENASARMDVFHFEQQGMVFNEEDAEMEMMDPGGLLLVLDRLAELSGGIVVDPQTSSLM